MRRILTALMLLICGSLPCTAGGPAFVAGSGFDPAVKGKPLTWAGGQIQYFTDQGDLSPILVGPQADAFVADALARWTTITGVTLTATHAGQLAEDVSGDNVIGYPDGSYSIPPDIQPTALGTPVGIVYDYDGKVTDALLGAGAGGLDFCFSNAVYGGPDNFSVDGHLVHALIVINGVCAAGSAQLPDVRYRLVRVLGRVLGLGWSQANLNVITRDPTPTAEDFQGFPVMHYLDPFVCVPIAACYPDADVPKMDDRAALRRLYPPAEQAARAARSKDSETGATRIHGSVYFTDAAGNPVHPMQGVNVVARRILANGQPSRQWVATSVSGFAFRGNAGNPINGYEDAKGQRYDRFGSDDPALEGAFDLGGLELADENQGAQYQISVEALDPSWSEAVEPYEPGQVAPSGSFSPVVVTVQGGADMAQDVLMLQSAIAQEHPGSGGTYANPAPLPLGAGWGAWISGYSDADWFQFFAREKRTASVAVTALDESGRPTQSKLMPVIGIWPLSDQSGGPAPAATPSAFNTFNLGMSRLDAQFFTSGNFRLGIADFRGDGRPDYSYQAAVLYSDSARPERLGVRGGVVTLEGIGFLPGLQVSSGATSGTVLSVHANELLVALPAADKDGTASITVADPVSGSFSEMTDVLTRGAAESDQLLLVQGSEPATPIGSEAANELRVQVVGANGTTPVSGATVAWSSNNAVLFSACGGATSCSVLSNEAGVSGTRVAPTAAGASTITATLAPDSYSSPASRQMTLVGTASALDLAATAPTKWIGAGATLDVELKIRALSYGVPQPGLTINFDVMKGSATLSAGSATTDASGYASVTAQLANHSGDVLISACVAPNNVPCANFTLFATPSSLWNMQSISGSAQVVQDDQTFEPLVLRVDDGSPAGNPVMGVTIALDSTLVRIPRGSRRPPGEGEGGGGMPVIIGTYHTDLQSGPDGLASTVPSAADCHGPCDVFISAAAGNSTLQWHLEAVE